MATETEERERSGEERRGPDDDKNGAGSGAEKKGGLKKKLGDRKELIIMIATIIGLFIAWMTFKSTSSSGTTGAAGTGSGGLGAGNVAGGGGKGGSAINGLNRKIQMLERQDRMLRNAIKHPAKSSSKPPGHRHFIWDPGGKKKGIRYLLNQVTGQIWQIGPGGHEYKLTRREWIAMGRPKIDERYGHKPKKHHKPPHHHKPPPKKHHKHRHVWGYGGG